MNCRRYDEQMKCRAHGPCVDMKRCGIVDHIMSSRQFESADVKVDLAVFGGADPNWTRRRVVCKIKLRQTCNSGMV